MTSEEFWEDNPKLFYSYYKCYEENEKKRYNDMNFNNWLQGVYNYNAMQISLTDFGYNFFSKNGNPNKDKFPTKPYNLFEDEKQDIKSQKLEKERVKKKNNDYLKTWASFGNAR